MLKQVTRVLHNDTKKIWINTTAIRTVHKEPEGRTSIRFVDGTKMVVQGTPEDLKE